MMVGTKKRTLRWVLLGLCAAVACFLLLVLSKTETEFGMLSLSSEDSAILLSWSAPDRRTCRELLVRIESADGESFEKRLPPQTRQLRFSEGTHGKTYEVTVSAEYRNGSTESLSDRITFLDYDAMRDLPLLIIDTATGKDPQYAEAEKPDDSLAGRTITENEYLSGSVRFIDGSRSFSDGIKLRVRGNTSALNNEKSRTVSFWTTATIFSLWAENLPRTNGYCSITAAI